MIYYNLFVMICSYIVRILNKIGIQYIHETHWWSAFSPLFSEFCLYTLNMLICVLSAY